MNSMFETSQKCDAVSLYSLGRTSKASASRNRHVNDQKKARHSAKQELTGAGVEN
jgi:hypothetical protein